MNSRSGALSVALLSPAVGSGNVGDSFIERAILRMLPGQTKAQRFSIRRALTDAEIEAVNQADVAILCGTNLYQHDWHSALTSVVLDRLRPPIVPFGVGGSAAHLTERSVGPTTRKMIRALHERCAIGSVRDPHSAEVVAAAGVKNILLTGCPVLYWAGHHELPAVRPARPKRIVLTARNWLMHRWPDNVDHPVQIALLRKLLDAFATHQLVFALHEDYDRRLLQRLDIPSSIVFQSEEPGDYVGLYTDPDNVVLALRLHAGMLAFANGVPTVFVGHDTRTYSFCAMLGLDCVELFDPDCALECVRRLQGALDGQPPHGAQAATAFSALSKATDQFLSANGLPARRIMHPEVPTAPKVELATR